jgi:hypothetical protein
LLKLNYGIVAFTSCSLDNHPWVHFRFYLGTLSRYSAK